MYIISGILKQLIWLNFSEKGQDWVAISTANLNLLISIFLLWTHKFLEFPLVMKIKALQIMRLSNNAFFFRTMHIRWGIGLTIREFHTCMVSTSTTSISMNFQTVLHKFVLVRDLVRKFVLKPFQNKRGQKYLRYPTKKQ